VVQQVLVETNEDRKSTNKQAQKGKQALELIMGP
jgi:hypothetical protein